MNYKKKKNKRLIITFLLAIIIVLISLIFKQNSSLTILQILSKDMSNKLIEIFDKPLKYIGEKIELRKEKEKIYNTYKTLKKNEDSIKTVLAENEELKDEVKNLKELNGIDSINEYTKMQAEVVKRNVTYWDNTITINKGFKSGVEEGMCVLNDKGFIGITTNVSNYYADVKLITGQNIDPKISVEVKYDDKNIPGILNRYDKDKKIFIVDGISEYSDIKKDAYVYTTSYNENIPSGILVGQVEEVTKDNYDLAKRLNIKSDVDFDNLRYVSILVRNK